MLFTEQAFKFETKDRITSLPFNWPFVSSLAIREGSLLKLEGRKRKRQRVRDKNSKELIGIDLSSSPEAAAASPSKQRDEGGYYSESRLGYLRDKIARGSRPKLPSASTPLFLLFLYSWIATATEQQHQQPDRQRARGSVFSHKTNRRHHSKSSNRESTSQSSLLSSANLGQEIESHGLKEDENYCSNKEDYNQGQLAICSAIHDIETTTEAADTVTHRQSSSVIHQVFVKTTSATTKSQQDNLDDSNELINLDSLVIQLVAIVCSLLAILYFVHFIQKIMTNLLSKILGGGSGSTSNLDRRRSLASNVNQHQTNSGQQAANAIAQSHSSSTLNLPRNSSSSIHQTNSLTSPSSSNQSYQQHQRRASRSSVHSLSAMLMSAITGGATNSNSANNGN